MLGLVVFTLISVLAILFLVRFLFALQSQTRARRNQQPQLEPIRSRTWSYPMNPLLVRGAGPYTRVIPITSAKRNMRSSIAQQPANNRPFVHQPKGA